MAFILLSTDTEYDKVRNVRNSEMIREELGSVISGRDTRSTSWSIQRDEIELLANTLLSLVTLNVSSQRCSLWPVTLSDYFFLFQYQPLQLATTKESYIFVIFYQLKRTEVLLILPLLRTVWQLLFTFKIQIVTHQIIFPPKFFPLCPSQSLESRGREQCSR